MKAADAGELLRLAAPSDASWGWLLDERGIASMVAGCAVILLGTGLATGLFAAPGWLAGAHRG